MFPALPLKSFQAFSRLKEIPKIACVFWGQEEYTETSELMRELNTSLLFNPRQPVFYTAKEASAATSSPMVIILISSHSQAKAATLR